MEPLDLEKEELTMGIEDIYVEEDELITRLLPYIPPSKYIAKVPKDLDLEKFMVSKTVVARKSTFLGQYFGPNTVSRDGVLGPWGSREVPTTRTKQVLEEVIL